MHNFKDVFVCGLLLILTQTSFSFAEVGRRTPSLSGIESAGPYYNPASKSYFELFRMHDGIAKPNWLTAKIEAEKKIFKNTKGRLAIVRDLASHQFINQHFKARNFWIGLQYFCRPKTLKWIDGTDVAASGFSAWASPWSNSSVRCGGKGFMPVHYTINTLTKTPRWRASGPEKFYALFLVEYPTGKE